MIDYIGRNWDLFPDFYNHMPSRWEGWISSKIQTKQYRCKYQKWYFSKFN